MNGNTRLPAPPHGSRLLQGVVVLSICVHLTALWLFNDTWSFKKIEYIELTLRQTYQPTKRPIPLAPAPLARPALKRHGLAAPDDALPALPLAKAKVKASQPRLPYVNLPDLTSLPSADIIPFEKRRVTPESLPPPDDRTRQSYFNDIRQRIDSRKAYPLSARQRSLEGAVVVRFILAADGRLISVEAVGGSSSSILRQAAIEAVGYAAPFPVIPDAMGRSEVSIRLTIHFDLETKSAAF